MKTFTLEEYSFFMGKYAGGRGCLLKPSLNYSKQHPVYQQRCDCLRILGGGKDKAYEDCNDCLGKGTPAIPIGELKG